MEDEDCESLVRRLRSKLATYTEKTSVCLTRGIQGLLTVYWVIIMPLISLAVNENHVLREIVIMVCNVPIPHASTYQRLVCQVYNVIFGDHLIGKLQYLNGSPYVRYTIDSLPLLIGTLSSAAGSSTVYTLASQSERCSPSHDMLSDLKLATTKCFLGLFDGNECSRGYGIFSEMKKDLRQ